MESVAIITGASSGIGRVSAMALADRGFSLCLVARNQSRLDAVCAAINAKHGPGRACAVAGDVTDPAVREDAVKCALSRWGRLDVLVNNAGTALSGAIEEVSLTAIREQFELNTFACIGLMQLVGPILRKQGHGRIINISSASGRIATPALGVYAATKFALEGLSDAARLEYKPWGIHVILIEPGSVSTEIWDKALAAYEHLDLRASPFRNLYESEREYAKRMKDKAPPAQVVADAVVSAATAKRPKARYCVPMEAKIANLLARMPTRFRDWLIWRSMKFSPGTP